MYLIHGTSLARAAALAVAATITCCGLVSLTPTPAAAATTPCPAGAPVPSDFDGDGLADLVVGAEIWGDEDPDYRAEWIRPGDGGAAAWITEPGELVPADLNGDVCADAIFSTGRDATSLGKLVKLVPGTGEGLDLSSLTEVHVPQAANVVAAVFVAAGLRHDGISQLVVAGSHYVDFEVPDQDFLDVFTLDAALSVRETQVITYPASGRDVGFNVLATDAATVAVGAPNATVKGEEWAGAVHLFTPDADHPTQLVDRLVLSQDSPGVPGTSEDGDHFGDALALRDGRLAIGVPGESDGRKRAGAVQPILWNESTHTYRAYRQIDQDTKGVPGTNEDDDQFGRNLAVGRGLTAARSYDILIGGTESAGEASMSGSVTVANFSRPLYRTYTQATKGVPGSVEAYDIFGEVGVLRVSPTQDTVLIGAPGENDGEGYLIRSDGRRLTSKTRWATIPVPGGAPGPVLRWGEFLGANR